MTITDYLKTKGFTRVEQSDREGRFLDPDYICKDGLFAELHDDGKFFMWTDPYNPILETWYSQRNVQYVKMLADNIIAEYETNIKISPIRIKS